MSARKKKKDEFDRAEALELALQSIDRQFGKGHGGIKLTPFPRDIAKDDVGMSEARI